MTSGELPIVAGSGTLTINGLGADQLSVSGNNQSRIFRVLGGANLTFNNLTVTGGASSLGGGILNQGVLTINNSAVTDCSSSGFGGGIASFGPVTINKSSVSSNFAQNAGGLVIIDTTLLSITDTTFSNNTTIFQGSAINLFRITEATLTNSNISGNM